VSENRNALSLRTGGVSLLLLLIAIVLFVLAAFGVDGKLGIGFLPLGLAFFAASFIL